MSVDIAYLDGRAYKLSTLTEPGVTTVLAEPTVPPVPAPPPGELVTIGDSFTDAVSAGELGWPVLLADRVDRELVNLGVVGSGYVHMWGGSSFPISVARLPATAEVVVVWGGYNDQLVPHTVAHVRAAAVATFALVHRIAPRARLVVAGPQWNVYSPPSATILGYRDAIRDAALAAGASWVDPIADGWFLESAELTNPDGLHPSIAGQPYVVGKLGPLVEAALAGSP